MMRKKRHASPGEAEEIGEVYRCMTIEEYKGKMSKAEQEAEQSRKELRNAERRLARMAEKVETTKQDTEGVEVGLDEVKKQLEVAATDCAHWKERTVELQRALRRIKEREFRGPKGISNAVESAIAALVNSGGKALSPPRRRVEGRIYELVNELAFTWRLPTPMIAGIVRSVSQATVDVCHGGHVDDVDIEMGEHYEFDERERGGSPVLDAVIAGPSDAVVPLPEKPSEGENA
ncbi:hypothetical protein BDM02DRAFT_2823232 [Thelephora ganbajun]|uniref:Uncharacterized protein n=1 Tax=Thelephora ganbajun TaxID=370292 RepID=A0ACB6ZCD4_THEGA|nr:hypothetical protein BDM02DRAFT_2823232 [Thelephora ganbajun]